MRGPSVTSIQVQPSLNAAASSAVVVASSTSSSVSSSSAGGDGLLSVSPQWRPQLWLLCANLAACGCIVGLSRLLPQIASTQFAQHSHSAVLMFVVTFGVSKALCNLLVGALANALGRRALLQCGWTMAALVPLLLWSARSWTWILWATAVLGASQGFCTSGAVVMLMDIVPARARGQAMGALECTIYVSLGAGSMVAAEIIARTGTNRAAIFVHALMCVVGGVAAWRTRDTSSLALHGDAEGDGAGAGDAGAAAIAKEHRSAARRWRRARHSTDKLVLNGSSSLTASDYSSSDEEDDLEGQRHHAGVDEPSASGAPAGGLEWNSLRRDSLADGGDDDGAGTIAPRPEPIALESTRLLDGGASGAAVIAVVETPLATPAPSDESSLQQRIPASIAVGADGSALRSASSNPPSSSPSEAEAGFLAALWSSVLECFGSSTLRSLIQAGFLNNFKDGVAWGLFPSFFSGHAATVSQLGPLLTAYPLVWGLGQLVTGKLSDKYGRGRFVWGGLALQAAAMAMLVAVPPALHKVHEVFPWLGLADPGSDAQVALAAVAAGGDGATSSASDVTTAAAAVGASLASSGLLSLSLVRLVLWLLVLVLLGLGTALSYPVLQAYIGDVVTAPRRASAIGLYRLCRDMGYAVGGLLSGRLADAQGVDSCLLATAAMLAASALYAYVCLPSDRQQRQQMQQQQQQQQAGKEAHKQAR